jgi:hypothetical protein
MPRGGRRRGAERKPGSLNKRTAESVKAMGGVGERASAVLIAPSPALPAESIRNAARLQGLLGACEGVLESISRPMLPPLAHGREFILNLRAQQTSVKEPAVDATGNGERDT